MKIKNIKSAVRSVRFFYLFYLVGVGLFYNLLPLYLQENLGFDATSIGVIMSVASIMSIGIATFWGIAADVTKNPKLILTIVLGCSGLIVLLSGKATTFVAMLIMMILFEFFRSGIFPLIDSTATTIAMRSDVAFSQMRWCGSLGYAVSILAFAPLLESIGLNLIFILFMFFLALPILFVRQLPNPATKEQINFKIDMKYLFTNKLYWFILFIGAFNFGSMNASSNYLALHVQTLGGGVLAVGICTLIAAGISEVHALMYVERIYHRLGMERTLLIGLGVTLFRWIVAFFAPNLAIFFLTAFCHGIAFAFVQPAVFTLIRRHVSESVSGTAIALNAAISGGVLTIINVITGNIIDATGSTAMMFIIFMIASLISIGLMLQYRKKV